MVLKKENNVSAEKKCVRTIESKGLLKKVTKKSEQWVFFYNRIKRLLPWIETSGGGFFRTFL